MSNFNGNVYALKLAFPNPRFTKIKITVM